MHALLGRMLWVYANLAALRLLLFCGIPLQDRSSEQRGDLPAIRKVRADCKARPPLYKPLHVDPRNDKSEDQRPRPTETGTPPPIQNIITKDNVSINIDAAVYFRVVNPRYAYYRVQNFNIAIAEVTYAILKNTCGQFILQDLLEKRQEIADDIEKQVDQYVMEWGVDVQNLLRRLRRSS
jgi:SPFH domain / Band 7 family